MKKIEKSIELGGRKLTISTGHVAEQADAAVMATYGETVVLATVVSVEQKEDRGYFPLFVEYRERLYAGGRIKGSRWVKREGRPSDDEILTARLIDRSIRPLFPKDYKKEVQVIVTVLSVDLKNSPDFTAGVAVSAALACSNIPWNGPVGTVKVGMKGKNYSVNPLDADLEGNEMELVVSTTKTAIVMIEAASKEVSEDKVIAGIKYAQKEAGKLISLIEKFTKEVGSKKEPVVKESVDKTLEKKVGKLATERLESLVKAMSTKEAGYSDYDLAKQAIVDSFEEEGKPKAAKIFDELFAKLVRKAILSSKRPDGRKADELRDLSAQTEILPRTHGSAIFSRGQTQVLSVTTLGASSLEQLIETAEGEESKRYIHHYSMPPFSVGETGRVGWPARREIGHGALAEKALLPVVPSEEKFPYTIRVVSETLSSNGSTSMASVCGSTLSLMDAGVPVSAPVAGIAMGLVIEDSKNYKILTDITGLEDGNGDMDFKVAGTEAGITVLQLDVKTLNLTLPILEAALKQAKGARSKILKVLVKAIAKPRESVSVHAPKIKVVKVPQDKIGEVIGPGGKVIRSIIAETGAQVDVEDDGSISISASSDKEVSAAAEIIEALTKEVKAEEIYDGEVKRVESFGAFVEILPGKDGMVHVSDMSQDFVKDAADMVKIGDKVKVRVKEIDNLGRINLSMILDKEKEKKKPPRRSQNQRRPREGFSRGRTRPGRPNYRPRGVPGRGRRSSGPHFPTSRLLDNKKDFS